MIRVAAVGDVHYDKRSRPEMREHLRALEGRADLFVIAGDLTQSGSPDEVVSLATDLKAARVPIVAVLGNHDFHQNREEEIRAILRDNGIITLEGETAVFRVGEHSVGIAGIKGFGGGFAGACVTDFGEPETKRFARHAREQAEILRGCLLSLDTDFRFALTHFSPIDATLHGEKREIYPFLGSYLLAEAIDAGEADAAFHGHAHKGVERGATEGGVPVRNVAQTVIRHSYNIYSFERAVSERGAAAGGEAVAN